MTFERPKVVRTCGVLAFRLRNVLLATMACTFWTALLPKVVRHCGVVWTFWVRNVLRATMACIFWTSQLTKVLWTRSGENIFTAKRARAKTPCTFSTCELPKVLRAWYVLRILTSKCSSRQNGLHFFDIWTSKKWSEHGVFFLPFWLWTALQATTECNFHLSSPLIWLHARRFSEPTFRPSGATKN